MNCIKGHSIRNVENLPPYLSESLQGSWKVLLDNNFLWDKAFHLWGKDLQTQVKLSDQQGSPLSSGSKQLSNFRKSLKSTPSTRFPNIPAVPQDVWAVSSAERRDQQNCPPEDSLQNCLHVMWWALGSWLPRAVSRSGVAIWWCRCQGTSASISNPNKTHRFTKSDPDNILNLVCCWFLVQGMEMSSQR